MKKYSCKNCNAELYWDAKSKSLKCEYCGSEFQPTDFEKSQEDNISQIADKVDKNTTATDESNSLELVMYKCTECGAEIITAKSTIATTCAYCGRAIALTDKLVGNFKPDYVIPFTISEKKAKAIYKKYCKSTFLIPRHFKKENEIKKIKGIYVPFWIFDTDTNSDFRYKGTRKRSWSDANYIYTETSYYSVVRAGNLEFSGVPVDGSSKIADDLMESIEPYDFSEAVDFETAYLAGYFADKYDMSAEDSISRADERIKRSTEQAFSNTIHGYVSLFPESSSVRLCDSKVRYALYPVWLLNTTWQGKRYTFAMNGQTGKFVGNLPLDKKAYLRWLAALTAISSAAVYAAAFIIHLI